ncbi:MAG: hydrogenobyrinic acid a,c-diamide synthase (glutamine-hydrolyzing) [Deltaproteobacteria bacterium]|nr:hydrogenobyrinic acid a,c-diamide synthase (glutamine-hydrolyzing) [Deltaproteobacteria bacterium]
MLNDRPRITIAALKGGSGKTILSLGLTSCWLKEGLNVAAFKKGPDFIDSGWLSFATRRPCYNLDPFLMTTEQIINSFLIHSADADVSVIEGNRGLFDGLDLEGRYSTAELATMLDSPVVIIVDVTMVTRTVAALIMGCLQFDPCLKIAGVILNKVAGNRQESLVRRCIEQYCGLPVVGAVPKLKGDFFPERHMGLIPHQERQFAEKALDWAGTVVGKNLNIETLFKLARDADPLAFPDDYGQAEKPSASESLSPRIGVIQDHSFWFYYPENLGQLKNLGATLVDLDSIRHREIPDVDAIYIGGGFPEVQAQALADNKNFKQALKRRIEAGLPVYAECGGLMYLGDRLVIEGNNYPMVGALPVGFVFTKKPQGHGYTVLQALRQNPYYEVGDTIRGHEFHYSKAVLEDSEKIKAVFKVLRGSGLDGQRDGICRKNLLGLYTHVHAGGNRLWAQTFFRQAALFKQRKISNDVKKKD